MILPGDFTAIPSAIVYVYHEHAGRNLPIGQTQVEMDLETRDHAHAEILVAALRRAGYRVELL